MAEPTKQELVELLILQNHLTKAMRAMLYTLCVRNGGTLTIERAETTFAENTYKFDETVSDVESPNSVFSITARLK